MQFQLRSLCEFFRKTTLVGKLLITCANRFFLNNTTALSSLILQLTTYCTRALTSNLVISQFFGALKFCVLFAPDAIYIILSEISIHIVLKKKMHKTLNNTASPVVSRTIFSNKSSSLKFRYRVYHSKNNLAEMHQAFDN